MVPGVVAELKNGELVMAGVVGGDCVTCIRVRILHVYFYSSLVLCFIVCVSSSVYL